MLFRLSNIPASFQRYINKILAKKLDVFVIFYLNDILIYTKDKGQAMSILFNGFSTNWESTAFLPT